MSLEAAAPPRILCCGLATLDVAQLVERVPGPNEKVAALDFLVAAGGPATNAAVAAARCGADVTLVTALPRHPLSDLITADLAGCGVTLDVVGLDADGAPPTAAIMVTRSTGDRAVVSPTGVATADREPVDALRDPARMVGVGALLIDGYHRHLALPLARAARSAGVPVILDGGSVKPFTEDLLAVTDVAVVSDDFAPPGTAGDSDAVLAYLAHLGVPTAVITRGAGTVLHHSAAGRGEVTVPPVSSVVDTLAAGDFFHGALAWRVAALGRDDARLPSDIAFAAAVVAESLGTFGTRAWLGSGPTTTPGTAP